jgi:hypothetical protein
MQVQFVLGDAVAVRPDASAANNQCRRAENGFERLPRRGGFLVAFDREREPLE